MTTKLFRKINLPLLGRGLGGGLLLLTVTAAAQTPQYDLTVCGGQSFMLTCPAEGADGLGPLTYQWYYFIDPATSATIGTNSATLTIPENYAPAGTYALVCVVANSACTLSSNSYTVEILGPPMPGIGWNPITCQGTRDVVFHVGMVSPGATYVWSGSAGTASGTGNGTYTVSGATAGVKSVSVYAQAMMENGLICRSPAHTVTATVIPRPTIDVQPTASSSVCVNGTVTLSVTASNDVTAYQWKKNGTNVTGGSGGNTANYTTGPLTENATYTVEVHTNYGSSCSATSNEALVAVYAKPSINTHSAAVSVCSGSAAQLSVTASNATGYQWRKGSANVTDGTGGNTANYTTAPLTANATYSVVVSNGLAACSATSGGMLVTVNPLPGAPTMGGAGTACGEKAITAAAGTNGNSIRWTDNSSTASPRTVTTSGTYRAVTRSAAGCESASASVTVTINALPGPPTFNSIYSYDNPICEYDPYPHNLYASAGTNGTGIRWTDNSSTVSPRVITANGTYTAVTRSAAGCESSPNTVLFAVYPTAGQPYDPVCGCRVTEENCNGICQTKVISCETCIAECADREHNYNGVMAFLAYLSYTPTCLCATKTATKLEEWSGDDTYWVCDTRYRLSGTNLRFRNSSYRVQCLP
jgi:hypothetical protein